MFVYCAVGISRYKPNMESNMRNYKTQLEYVLHASELSVLLSRAGELFSTLPRGHAIVSDVNGGEFYGIESGKYYPTKLLLRLNRLIQTEGKYDWIQWHSTYDGLSYHVGQVCSNDYKFIHGISSLPENAKEIPTHSEIMAHIENNPVGTDGYTNSGTPTDKTYEDAKRELEKETYAYTGDPIIPLEGQF